MANSTTNVSMFKTQSPYEQQIEEMKRRQQMAEMLQQQAFQPLESQVAPGGMVVPTSPVLGLAKMLQAYMGGKQLRDIEKQRGEVEKGARSEALDYLRSFNPEQKTIGMGEAAVSQLPMPQVGNNGQVSYQAPSVTAMPNARPVASLDQPMQMQVGGPLNRQDQMRRAEEGIFSDNPLVRALAQTKYEAANRTVNPMDYLSKFDPDKLTPESLQSLQADIAAGRTPDVSRLASKEKLPETLTPFQRQTLDIDRARLDFQKSKAGQTADRPKPPPGFRYTKDGNDYEFVPGGPNDPNAVKAMPPSMLSANISDAGDAKRLQGNKDMLQGFIDDLSGDNPKLPLSATKIAIYRANQATSGVMGLPAASDATTRYFELERAVNEQVNAVLNLAKGPQTDQDARRAQKQILDNMNDRNIVTSGLRRLQEIYDRETGIRNDSIAERNAAYGRGGGTRSNW
jgi:hypothetical protein